MSTATRNGFPKHARSAAETYLHEGLSPTSSPARSKHPDYQNWQQPNITIDNLDHFFPRDVGTARAGAIEALRDYPAAGRPPSLAAAMEPLLVRAPDAARLCGVSEATWHRLRSAGRTPAPVQLGGAVLWRVSELRDWCAAGCPDHQTWEALKKSNRR
jgi:predicted DNA-binding transcriptional regulator AlpA